MPGIPSLAEVNEFIRSPRWVDVYAAVSANFFCPKGRGLKRVAPVAGFSWRDGEANGAASMDWYCSAAVGLTGRNPTRTNAPDRCSTTGTTSGRPKVLREWMDGDAVRTLPTMAGLAGLNDPLS